MTGTVTTEVKGEGSGDNTGRISYENRGECFFLPYTKDDVEGNVTLRTGDAVSFQIATNQRLVFDILRFIVFVMFPTTCTVFINYLQRHFGCLSYSF